MTRDDLRLVLMSATINIDLFQNYFEGCPIIQVPGRLYPIQLQYRPPGNENQFSKESTNKRINPMPIIRILQVGWNFSYCSFSKRSHFLERVLMEHIDMKSRLDSELQCAVYVPFEHVLENEISSKNCSR